MIAALRKMPLALLALLVPLVLGGCQTVATMGVSKIYEDRNAEVQVVDGKIWANFNDRLAEEDKSLVLDLALDVWERRALLTGVVATAAERSRAIRIARSDRRITRLYSHIKVVPEAERDARREQSSNSSSSDSGIKQTVNDFWLETKIQGNLLAAEGVKSVNYRWRSVLNHVYIIGRARSAGEQRAVLRIIKSISGVKSVTEYITVRPVPSS